MKFISILFTLLLLPAHGLAYYFWVGSAASGWIDVGSGSRFFNSAEELCNPGVPEYGAFGSDWTVACSNNWRILGIFGFVCPSGYFPSGYPLSWQLGGYRLHPASASAQMAMFMLASDLGERGPVSALVNCS